MVFITAICAQEINDLVEFKRQCRIFNNTINNHFYFCKTMTNHRAITRLSY